jgi:hypothetical protein
VPSDAPTANEPNIAQPTTRSYDEPTEHRLLHRIILGIAFSALIGLVIENTFTQPFILVYYGWPQRSILQVCDYLYQISYNDPRVKCTFPYPLFGPPEPSTFPASDQNFGPVTPPVPPYQVPGFRQDIVLPQTVNPAPPSTSNPAALPSLVP